MNAQFVERFIAFVKKLADKGYCLVLTIEKKIISLKYSRPMSLKKFIAWISALAFIVIVPIGIRLIIWGLPVSNQTTCHMDLDDLMMAQEKLNREIGILNKKLNAKQPQSFFLVINSASNEFVLYKGNQVIKKDKCSTGSYVLLKNGDHQQWMFKTPKGEFRILGKTTSPVWKKPDWAFVEEGLPVPPLNDNSRFEYGVLGDYALSLGHGYLIHGTLYQRFLGLPVTHGCIRLNDENLELVYRSLKVGSKVYIY